MSSDWFLNKYKVIFCVAAQSRICIVGKSDIIFTLKNLQSECYWNEVKYHRQAKSFAKGKYNLKNSKPMTWSFFLNI